MKLSYARLILISIISLILHSHRKVEQKLTDIQLLEQVKDSDMEAFRILFDRYQPVLFRQVLFQTGQTDVSHDIVQETFIRIWEHRGSLRPRLSFLAYALRISRNLIYDAMKHQKVRERSKKFLPSLALSEQDDPAEALQFTLLKEKITTIINDNLPQRCREIILLSRFEGKTNQEIAESLHLSVRTVEHQISYALKILRKNLDR